MDEQILVDLVPEDADVSGFEDKTVCNDTILNNVTIDRVHMKEYLGSVGAFCVVPHNQDQNAQQYVTICSGKRMVHMHHLEQVTKVKLPSEMLSFKILYNLEYFV